jgi:hypothetical protein
MKLSERLARLSLQDAPDVAAIEAAAWTPWSARPVEPHADDSMSGARPDIASPEPSPWQVPATTSPTPDGPPAPAPAPAADDADPWAAGGWSAPSRWDTQDVVPPFEGVTGLGEPPGETWSAWGDLAHGADEHGSQAETGTWAGSDPDPPDSSATPAAPVFGGVPATPPASPLFGDTASPFLGSAADPVLGGAAPRGDDRPIAGTALRPWDPHSAVPVEMPHELRLRYGLDQATPAPQAQPPAPQPQPPAPPPTPTTPAAPTWAPAPTAPGPWDTLPPPPPTPTTPAAPTWAPAPTAPGPWDTLPPPPPTPTTPAAPTWAPAPTAPGPWDTLPPPPPTPTTPAAPTWAPAPTAPAEPTWAPAPTAWQPPAHQEQDPGLWATLPPPPAAPPAAPAAGGWHTPDPTAAHVVVDTMRAPAHGETPAFPEMPPPPWAEADDPFADLRSLPPDPGADAASDPPPAAPGLPPQAEIDEALASLYSDIPPTDLDQLDAQGRRGPRWLRWARRLGKGRKKDSEETPERSCPSCGGTARVDIYDPWRGLLHMSCDSCFRMWQEVEMPEVPALPSSS